MIATAREIEDAAAAGVQPCYVFSTDPKRDDEGHAYLVRGQSGETYKRETLPAGAVYAGRFTHCLDCNQIKLYFLEHISAATEHGETMGFLCNRCRVVRVIMERVPQ
jgi:hypothetical protein